MDASIYTNPSSLFGRFLVVGVYPIAGMLPGDDHGAYENFDNTLAKLQNNPTIVFYSAIFCGSVCTRNLCHNPTIALSSLTHVCQCNVSSTRRHGPSHAINIILRSTH